MGRNISMMCLEHKCLALGLVIVCVASRRRHTRCLSDWSSDVCSSDLLHRAIEGSSRGHELLPDRSPGAERNGRSWPALRETTNAGAAGRIGLSSRQALGLSCRVRGPGELLHL